jgi:hypothetical protein
MQHAYLLYTPSNFLQPPVSPRVAMAKLTISMRLRVREFKQKANSYVLLLASQRLFRLSRQQASTLERGMNFLQ